MGLIDQLVLLAFLGLGAALWMEAAHAMREAHGSLARSARRMDYAEAALKELQRETSSLRRLQKQKAGLRQAETRLNEATTRLLTKTGDGAGNAKKVETEFALA